MHLNSYQTQWWNIFDWFKCRWKIFLWPKIDLLLKSYMITWKNKHKTLLYYVVNLIGLRWGCTSSPNTIFYFLPVLQAWTMRQVFFSGPSFVMNEIGSRYKFYAALCSDAILVCYFVIRWRCVYLISNSVEISFTVLSNFN